MPEGRHTARLANPRNSGGSLRARYVRPIRRNIYVQKPALDTVAAVATEKKTDHPNAGKQVKAISSPPRGKNLKPALPRQAKSTVLARHVIKRKPAPRLARRASKIRLHVFVIWFMAVAFGMGSIFAYMTWRNDQRYKHTVLAKNTDQISETTKFSENDVPAEIIAGYEVGAELPRVIKIPRLQIEARIKRVVARSNGELTAPSNINDAGWYDGSVMPGEAGTSLLVGHVFGTEQPGVFNRINNLIKGDSIHIERGDGKLLEFIVTEVEQISQEAFALERALKSSEQTSPSLHLLTHTGRYDVRTNKYENRILIKAFQK